MHRARSARPARHPGLLLGAPLLPLLALACTPPTAADTPDTASTTSDTAATGSTTGAAAPTTSDGSSTGEPTLPPPTGMPADAPLTRWVDPFIGTGGKGYGTGSAFPGPQLPFGLARPGPDTALPGGLALGFAHCSGYSFEDTVVLGFSQTRMHGTGIVDYGAVSFMPTLGFTPAKALPKGVMQSFDKASESASPGRYALTLADGIGVELTATARVGLHRFSFPAGQPAAVVLDLGRTLPDVEVVDAELSVDPDGASVRGFMHVSGGYSNRAGGVTIYYAARFDRPLTGHGVWQDGTVVAGETTREGPAIGAYFEFAGDAPVVLGVGLSFVDAEHAAMNLAAEAPALDFDAAQTAAEATWEAHLGRAELHGPSPRDFEIFYSALYHTLLMPTLASDVDGSYRGLDTQVHTADFDYYTDLSLWDTFRSEHPLLVLLYPEYQTAFLRSLTRMARDGGYMPRWPLGTGYTGGMLGENSGNVSNSYWNAARYANSAGGLALTAEKMRNPGSFNTWSISADPAANTVWFSNGTSAPMLRNLLSTNRWIGKSGDWRWTSADNWTLQHAPQAWENARIGASNPGMIITLDGKQTAKDLNSATSLRIESNSSLTLADSSSLSDGLQMASDTARLLQTAGTLKVHGETLALLGGAGAMQHAQRLGYGVQHAAPRVE